MKKKLLIVEDDADIANNLKVLLEEEGYRVHIAQNGKLALDILRTAHCLPSLILLDLMMPIMDGFEFRREQLSDPKLASIRVVIMSADGHVAEKLAITSADAYLTKPFEMEKIINVVELLS